MKNIARFNALCNFVVFKEYNFGEQSYFYKKHRALKILSCTEIWTISTTKDSRQGRSRRWYIFTSNGRLYNFTAWAIVYYLC